MGLVHTEAGEEVARRALTMLAHNLEHFGNRAAIEAAYIEAGIDLDDWGTVIAHAGAHLAAVLLLHSYAEAESYGICLTEPADLVARYKSLADP